MKKKLLMTASSYEHIQRFHLPYLCEFQRLGWETHLACPGAPEQVPGVDRTVDLPFLKAISSPLNFRSAARLRKLIREERYDLIITHTSLASFFTCLAVKGMADRPKLINVMHGYLFDNRTPHPTREMYDIAERLIAPQTDLLITMNDWDWHMAVENGYARRVERSPGMGVDFARLDQATDADGAALRGELGIPEDATVLIYAAEFSKRKGQKILIETMTQLPESCWLALPGDGIYLQEWKQLAAQLGLAERVIFPGQREDIGRWFRMADIAVSVSRSEGLPFNVMEAMYAGLPVVASNVKGHTDLIRDGETGLLYPYGDRDACARQILRLMEDPALFERLRSNAREMILPYGLQTTLPALMQQYLSVMAGSDIRVVVATHKEYRMPADPLYLPVQAGAALHPPLPYTPDNTGPNISEKNPGFCELTCLYWAWQNLQADAVGLCHYRRHFAGRRLGGRWDRVLTLRRAEKLLQKAPVVLPEKRNYFIETGYSQYVHAHHRADLVATEAVLAERWPEYLPAFTATLQRTYGHRFNMFLMRRPELDSYCAWLFDVLFELEKRLDISDYNDYDRRVFGFVGERLLDVWLETNHISYVECPVLHMESQHWLAKGTGFLRRKFRAAEK